MSHWQQGQVIEVAIASLSDQGEGVGRYDDRIVFVPDTVTGDRVRVKLLHVKPQFAHGRLEELLTPSPHRIRPRCIVADKCGGCQWQQVSDAYQAEAKVQILREALQRIGGFENPVLLPMLQSEAVLHYRNKATYPIARSATGTVQMGYYRRGTHQLINLNQCPVQDARLDPLLAAIKLDIAAQGWSIYNETEHRGRLRHLSLRIGRRTGELLLTLVSTTADLANLTQQAAEWQARYPDLVGVCVNLNPERTNAIFGERTEIILGRDYLREEFAGLTFQLRSHTFFQVNTEAAEALLGAIATWLKLQGTETLVDAYCGIGTFTLPLAKQVESAIGVESQRAAIAQAESNATLNEIPNVGFYCARVKDWLQAQTVAPDVVLLDPPRKGCDRAVIESLLRLKPDKIVYVSCKPATLARDLQRLCANGIFTLEAVQPADFFPQTAHVECAAYLRRA